MANPEHLAILKTGIGEMESDGCTRIQAFQTPRRCRSQRGWICDGANLSRVRNSMARANLSRVNMARGGTLRGETLGRAVLGMTNPHQG